MKSSLTIRAGERARKALQKDGLSPDRVKVIAGAAGGPKWLILNRIDRALFGKWIRPRPHPLHLVGASIGAWRFAAAAQKDPNQAIDQFEKAYLGQRFPNDATSDLISEVSEGVLTSYLTPTATDHLLNHDFYRLHVLAVRCKNLVASEDKSLLLAGLGMAYLGNIVHPSALQTFFSRTVFTDKRTPAPFLKNEKLKSEVVDLSHKNLKDAILASGSIPGVMNAVKGIEGTSGELYRDGGVLDYHLDLPLLDSQEDGFVLFPHFSDRVVPNWFDKSLPWRKPNPRNFENTILIAPSKEFIASLPHRKIPDRNDFYKFKEQDDERVSYWQRCLAESERMADELLEILETGHIDELVKPFPAA